MDKKQVVVLAALLVGLGGWFYASNTHWYERTFRPAPYWAGRVAALEQSVAQAKAGLRKAYSEIEKHDRTVHLAMRQQLTQAHANEKDEARVFDMAVKDADLQRLTLITRAELEEDLLARKENELAAARQRLGAFSP